MVIVVSRLLGTVCGSGGGRHRLVQEVKNGIGYLRNRLTGNCEPNYDCTQMFEVYRLVQAFDPSFAAQHINQAWVDAMTTIPPRALVRPNSPYGNEPTSLPN